MPSKDFQDAQIMENTIAEYYTGIETMEQANSFDDGGVPVLSTQRARNTIMAVAADFTAFKSSVLARLRTALASAYTAYNTAYAAIAYDTVSTPAGLVLTPGPSTIEVAFDAVAGADSYRILRSQTNDVDTAILLVEQTTNDSVTYAGNSGETYYFWVRAKRNGYTDSAHATDSAIPS